MSRERPGPESLVQEIVDLHLAEAARSPRFAQAILGRLRRILARFTHFYRRLLPQPRRTRRTLKAKLATTLAGAALLLALSATPAHAATITVDGTTCTLVDAITAAETDSATGGCAAGSGADILELAAGATFTLALTNNTSFGPSGTPLIDSEITINGNGATIERDVTAQEYLRIFTVGPLGNLTLNNATVTGGDTGQSSSFRAGGGIANFFGQLAVNDSIITGNVTSSVGGGLYNCGASTTITRTEISDNQAYSMGGGVATFARGSGKYATLDIVDSTISGNTVFEAGAFGGGGGAANIGPYNGSSSLTITTSTISNNDVQGHPIPVNPGPFASAEMAAQTFRNHTGHQPDGVAGGFGGGVHTFGSGPNTAGTEINQSTVSGNIADVGGGVATLSVKYASATTAINHSTLSGNYSVFGGGGLVQANVYGRNGSPAGSTTVNNSTISGNSTVNIGGGILSYNFYTRVSGRSTISGNGGLSEMDVNDTTVTNNTAYVGGGLYNYWVTSALERTIISGNAAEFDNEGYAYGASPATDNYNLFGLDGAAGLGGLFVAGATDAVPGAGVFVADIVNPLGDYGGGTNTHLLPPGSLAIDGVPTAACGPTMDQRGEARPALDGCDIGAVEVQAPTDVALTGFSGDTNAPTALAGLLTAALSALGLAGWLTRRRRPLKVE